MSESRLARRLTGDELERLLQRAVERQALEEKRPFTLEELVAAGGELGLEAEVVQAVYREHMEDSAAPAGRPRPLDSALRLDREGDTFQLTMPPSMGTRVTAALQTIGAAGIVGTMLAAALPTPVVVAAAAIALAFGYFRVRAGWTVRQLRLGRDGSGLLIRFTGRGGRGKGIPLQAGQVRARLAERVVEGKHATRHIPYLALDHGTDTWELLEGYTHAEQSWAVEEIHCWLSLARAR